MAVTGTITITTLLFFYIARWRWRAPRWLLIVGGTLLLVVDLFIFAANLTKVTHGAWVPLLIGLAAFTVLITWQRGRETVTRERQRREGSLREFVDEVRTCRPPLAQVPGTAVFLNRGKQATPLALRANAELNHVRHEHILIVSIDVEPVPQVPPDNRVTVDDLGYADDGIFFVTIRAGYTETPNVLDVLRTLDPALTGGRPGLDQASFFLSRVELRPGKEKTMARWRKRLFLATSRLTADAAEHFGLPPDRTVTLGSQIDI
jgi:KUP system potassium uptake protein